MMNRADVHQLFHSQFGVADLAQLVSLGLSPSTVLRTQRRGAIAPVLPGVFQVAGGELSFRGKAMAAQLHGGYRSFLSGTTAAALWGARAMPMNRVEITVVGKVRTHPAPWMRVRRSVLDRDDDVVTRDDGLRLATPLRTLFTLAIDFNAYRFHRAAEDLWHLRLMTPDEAGAYLGVIRRSGRTGVKRFEDWLVDVSARTAPSQSHLELDVIEAVRAVGLPDPVRQYPLVLRSGETIHIDIAWPGKCLGLEPGHSWHHGGDLQMRKDHARDRACAELGWQIVRLDEDLRDDLMSAALPSETHLRHEGPGELSRRQDSGSRIRADLHDFACGNQGLGARRRVARAST